MATSPIIQDTLHDFCANDPFGNFVVLPVTIKDLEGNFFALEPLYNEAMDAISDPVFILDMEDDEVSFYYYRKFNGENSILVGAKKSDDHFEASRCQQNPSSAQLSVLFKKAKQIH